MPEINFEGTTVVVDTFSIDITTLIFVGVFLVVLLGIIHWVTLLMKGD